MNDARGWGGIIVFVRDPFFPLNRPFLPILAFTHTSKSSLEYFHISKSFSLRLCNNLLYSYLSLLVTNFFFLKRVSSFCWRFSYPTRLFLFSNALCWSNLKRTTLSDPPLLFIRSFVHWPNQALYRAIENIEDNLTANTTGIKCSHIWIANSTSLL